MNISQNFVDARKICVNLHKSLENLLSCFGWIGNKISWSNIEQPVQGIGWWLAERNIAQVGASYFNFDQLLSWPTILIASAPKYYLLFMYLVSLYSRAINLWVWKNCEKKSHNSCTPWGVSIKDVRATPISDHIYGRSLALAELFRERDLFIFPKIEKNPPFGTIWGWGGYSTSSSMKLEFTWSRIYFFIQ